MRDITYSYDSISSNFRTLSVNDSSVRVAKLLSALTFEGTLAQGIEAAIDGAGRSGESYADAYALELSREVLAYSSFIYEPAQVESVHSVETGLGAQLELVPLSLFLVTLLLFWCVVPSNVTVRFWKSLLLTDIPRQHLHPRCWGARCSGVPESTSGSLGPHASDIPASVDPSTVRTRRCGTHLERGRTAPIQHRRRERPARHRAD